MKILQTPIELKNILATDDGNSNPMPLIDMGYPPSNPVNPPWCYPSCPPRQFD